MTPIIIPQLDTNIVDVTITQWYKQVGDAVEKGEIIAVLTTDKAAYEFESPASGILLSIVAQTKSIVMTGSVIGAIGDAGEKVEVGPSSQGQQDAAGTGRCACPVTGRCARTPVQPRIRATPRARRMAAEKGFDLAAIQAVLGIEIIDEAAIAAYEQTTGDNR